MDITLGPITVNDDHVNLQVHRKEEDIVHILSVIMGANVKLRDGSEISGAIVDIDSIRNIAPTGFKVFASELDDGAEQLRRANKAKFFGCPREETIEEMGPIHE